MGLTADRLEELSRDDANRIYTFKYDEVERVLEASVVRTKLQQLRYIVKRNVEKEPGWLWAQHKAHIKAQHPDLWELTTTHPKMFDVASHPKSTKTELHLMHFMLNVREQVESKKLTEAGARHLVSDALINAFKLEKGKTKADTTPWNVSTRPG